MNIPTYQKPSPLAGEGGARRDSGGRVRGQRNNVACGTPSSANSANAELPPSPTRGEGELQQFAKQMRLEMTPAERKLWSALKGRRLGGYKFKRQIPIGNYIVDFVCFKFSLIIEVDGGQHNDSAYDVKRDTWLTSQDFRVERFWNPEVMDNTDGVCQTILDLLIKQKENLHD